jgi:hypothetical protein
LVVQIHSLCNPQIHLLSNSFPDSRPFPVNCVKTIAFVWKSDFHHFTERTRDRDAENTQLELLVKGVWR